MASKQLGNLLNPCNDGDLGDIVRRAREMGELTGVLARALPEEQARAIVAANVREGGELVVIAATSAWASRLRYETEVLLAAARASGFEAHTCRIRVSQG
ncbi:MAG: DciA family protein [Woeseiaceae bacterium]